MNNYYTYAYLRKDKTPYYIGKGKENRIYKKGNGEVYPPKDKSRIIFLKQNLTEEQAFKHEIYMIAVFGRKNKGTGILHNKTDGGEGSSGYKHTPKAKKNMSVKRSGKKHPNYGKTHSDETKKKMSEAKKGFTHSEETKKKIGMTSTGRRHTEKTKEIISKKTQGENNPFFGKSHSKETKEKIGLYHRGKKLSQKHKEKLLAVNKSKKLSQEHKDIISLKCKERNLGRKWWNNGQINKFVVECPGEEWISGRVRKKL